MMRALWTGASGMIAQQTSLDNIANNLANVNTTGYKREQTEFQSLLYSKLQTRVTDHEGNPKPVIGQVGLGVRVASIVSNFTQGSLTETGRWLDAAIDGEGFYSVRRPDGTVGYTRNGSFKLGMYGDVVMLCSSDGYPVLDTEGEPISFPATYDTANLSFDQFGNLTYTPNNRTLDQFGHLIYSQNDSNTTQTIATLALTQFNNPAGLLKLSGSLFQATDASGEPRLELTDMNLKRSRIVAQYVEASNVQTADEIVNLIVTQRAYEMNSKVIQASDEMLQQANNLRS